MDGVDYTQSTALLRYAGRLAGIYPEDPVDAMKVELELTKRLPDVTNSQCTVGLQRGTCSWRVHQVNPLPPPRTVEPFGIAQGQRQSAVLLIGTDKISSVDPPLCLASRSENRVDPNK